MSIQTITRNIIKNYPVFEGSQVLTSDQLNNLFGYLDQQERYTRSRLIGVGIVCGLQVRSIGDTVQLSEGIGITSDGFLMKMPECNMNYYRDYTLPTGVIYEPFGDYDDDNIFTQDDDIRLFEFLANKPQEGEFKTLENSFFRDKYLLIYLECYDRDPRSCLGKNCEDLGRERIFTTRKLAVSKEGLIRILNKANAGVDNPFFTVSNLPIIDIEKPLFHKDGLESKTLIEYSREIVDKIFALEDPQKPFNQLFGLNEEGLLLKTYDEYEPILNSVYNYQNPLLDSNSKFNEVKSTLREFLNSIHESDIEILGAQYAYEYINILNQAYFEFVHAGEEIGYACGAEKSFSLHLMLGKIVFDKDKESDELDLLGQSRFRHQFLQPKIFNQQDVKIKRLINLHKRLVLIIESFNGNKVNQEPLPLLKITPSTDDGKLSNRSIPVLLDATLSFDIPGLSQTNLEREWDFDASIKSRNIGGDRMIRTMSYDRNTISEESTSEASNGPIESPLYFNNQQNAYVIEGIYNGSVSKILAKEKDLKDYFQLPYETLILNLANIDENDRSTYQNIVVEQDDWIDIQTSYDTARASFLAIIKNLDKTFTDFQRETQFLNFGHIPANLNNYTNTINEIRLDYISNDLANSKDLSTLLAEIVGLLPTGVQDLYKNGNNPIPFNTLKEVYRDIRRFASRILLKLEHAIKILIFEKVEVLPADFIPSWQIVLFQLKNHLVDFLDNGDFYQLHILYFKFVYRYDYLQRNHYSIFSNFLKYHPGLSIGPVNRGGTHILLGNGNGGNDLLQSQVVGNFKLPYPVNADNLSIPLDPTLNQLKVPPLARGEAFIVIKGEHRILDVTTNDLDPNGDSLKIKQKGYTDEQGAFQSGSSANGGKVVSHQSSNSVIRYESKNTFTGEDNFEYVIQNTEDNNLTDSVQVEVLVIEEYLKHVKANSNLAATDNFHSIVIDILGNDTVYDSTQLIIPEKSNFGAPLSLRQDKKVIYTPIYGREGKDGFNYQLKHTRSDDSGEMVEESSTNVDVIVFCCERLQLEFVCEGNISEFDVQTTREKQNESELFLLTPDGTRTKRLATQNGIISVARRLRNAVVGFDNPIGSPLGSSTQATLTEPANDELLADNGKPRIIQPAEIDLGGPIGPVGGPIGGGGIGLPIGDDEDGNIGVGTYDVLIYEPNPYFIGDEEFIYEVVDNEGFLRRVKLQVMVLECHDVKLERTLKDTQKDFYVLEAGERRLRVFDQRSQLGSTLKTAHGTVRVSDNDGGFEFLRYTPDQGYSGLDVFNYTVEDAEGTIHYNTLQVIIDSVEKVKVVSTFEDTLAEYEVFDEELIANGYGFSLFKEKGSTISRITTDLGGSVSVDFTPGNKVKYLPADGFIGEDFFEYEMTLNSEVIEYGRFHVIVTENKRITVEYTLRDHLEQITVTESREEKLIEVFETSVPESRAEKVNESGVINYFPAPGFIGQDSFTYLIEENGNKLYGTVHMIVDGGQQRIEIETVCKNETKETVLYAENRAVNNFEILTDVTNGTADFNGTRKSLTYSPNADFIGRDKLDFRAQFNNAAEFGSIFFIVTELNEIIDLQTLGVNEKVEFSLKTDGDKISDVEFIRESTNGKSTWDQQQLKATYEPNEAYAGSDKIKIRAKVDDKLQYFTVLFFVEPLNETVPLIEVKSVTEDTTLVYRLFDENINVSEFIVTRPTRNGRTGFDEETGNSLYTPNPGFLGEDKVEYEAIVNGIRRVGSVFFIVTCACDGFAVTGTVTDEESGQLLGDVNIQEVGTDNKVVNGSSGVFNIQAADDGTLRFSRITHETKEVAIAGQSTLNVKLKRRQIILTGTVKDEEGNPVRGVVIAVESGDSTIDEKGAFRINTSAGSTIRFSAPGYNSREIIAPNSNEEQEIILSAARVQVFVTARDSVTDQMLFGNSVEEVGTNNSISSNSQTPITVNILSELSFNSPGYVNKVISVNSLSINNDNQAFAEISLDPANIMISGNVLDSDGKPISEAEILSVELSGETGVSNSRGFYTITLPLRNGFFAKADRFNNSEIKRLIPNTGEAFIEVTKLGISNDNKTEVNFTLVSQVFTLSGKVIDALGNPLVGVSVFTDSLSTDTDEKGDYVLELTESGNVFFTAINFVERNEFVNANQNRILNITLNAVDVALLLRIREEFNDRQISEINLNGMSADGTSYNVPFGSAVTNSLNVNLLDTVKVQSLGFNDSEMFLVKDLPLEGSSFVLDLTLTYAIIEVSGNVTDSAKGGPVEGVSIQVDQQGSIIETNSAGFYSVDIKAYQSIHAVKEGYRTISEDIRLANFSRRNVVEVLDNLVNSDNTAPNINFFVEKETRNVFGTVSNENGERIRNARITSEIDSDTSDSSGRFNLEVPVGSAITISADNYVNQTITPVGNNAGDIELIAKTISFNFQVRDSNLNKDLLGVEIFEAKNPNDQSNVISIGSTNGSTNSLNISYLSEIILSANGFETKRFRIRDFNSSNDTVSTTVQLDSASIFLSGSVTFRNGPAPSSFRINVNGSSVNTNSGDNYSVNISIFDSVSISADGYNNSASFIIFSRISPVIDVRTSGISNANVVNHNFSLTSSGPQLITVSGTIYLENLATQFLDVDVNLIRDPVEINAARNKTPLQGVTIIGDSTQNEVITDSRGNYSIRISSNLAALTIASVPLPLGNADPQQLYLLTPGADAMFRLTNGPFGGGGPTGGGDPTGGGGSGPGGGGSGPGDGDIGFLEEEPNQ